MTRIELIAECSTSHGGNIALAKEFIDRFAEAGADWIKFQYTRVRHLRPTDHQFEWFRQAELSDEQFAELKAHTESRGAKFLLTVYNHQDVAAVATLSPEAIKVGSGEAHETQLAEAVLGTLARSVFVSTGLSGAKPYQKHWPRVTFFHCVSRYPHPVIENQGFYDLDHQGWSDHSIWVECCELAILRGARYIEKHVQLPNQARPVRPFEATVDEWKALRQFADDDPSRFLGRWQAQ